MARSLGRSLSWQRAREFAGPLLEPVVALVARAGLSANAVTLLGLAVAAASAYPIATGHLVIGGAVLLGGSLLDLLDGAVARRRGSVSRFGALLDSTADRLGEGASLLGLLLFYLWKGHTWGVALAFGAFWASVMVSYIRARAEGLDIQGRKEPRPDGAMSSQPVEGSKGPAEGIAPRPLRVAVLVGGLLAGQPFPSLVIITSLAAITAAQRLYRARSAW